LWNILFVVIPTGDLVIIIISCTNFFKRLLSINDWSVILSLFGLLYGLGSFNLGILWL
jgi:hypothetical protein